MWLPSPRICSDAAPGGVLALKEGKNLNNYRTLYLL